MMAVFMGAGALLSLIMNNIAAGALVVLIGASAAAGRSAQGGHTDETAQAGSRGAGVSSVFGDNPSGSLNWLSV